MGDRAVIGFKADENSTPIWLYMHHRGLVRHSLLATAIDAASGRWDDPAYATRIAISSIVGNNWSDETGFGLSCGDDGFPSPDWNDIPVVIWSDQLVEIYNERDMRTPIYHLAFHEYSAARMREALEVLVF